MATHGMVSCDDVTLGRRRWRQLRLTSTLLMSTVPSAHMTGCCSDVTSVRKSKTNRCTLLKETCKKQGCKMAACVASNLENELEKSTTIFQRSYKKHRSLKRSDIVKRDKHCNSFNETSKVLTVIWNALNFKLSKPFKTLQPSIYQCHVIIIFAALQTSKFWSTKMVNKAP